MGKRVYNKLVRDKVPQIIAESGEIPTCTVCSQHTFSCNLVAKMVEELEEFLAAEEAEDEVQQQEELADVLEVFLALVENRGFSIKGIEAVRLMKRRRCGGFKKRIFLECVED